MSPIGLPIPRTNPRLTIWGDREIKDVLREFKVIGGYKKEGVRVTFTTEEEGNEGPKTRAKEGSSSHCISCNEVMNTLATILDRQTSIIERQYGSQLPYNSQVAYKHVLVTRKWGSPYKGERTSNPVTFRTPSFGFGDHSKGHGHFTEENKGLVAFTP